MGVHAVPNICKGCAFRTNVRKPTNIHKVIFTCTKYKKTCADSLRVCEYTQKEFEDTRRLTECNEHNKTFKDRFSRIEPCVFDGVSYLGDI